MNLVLASLVVVAFVGCGSSSSSGDGTPGGDRPCARYQVIDAGTGTLADAGPAMDGSGLVLDTTTGLTWLRNAYYPAFPPGQNWEQATSYCQGRGMRLPTKDEVLAIAGAQYCQSAWPARWGTWTSTPSSAGVAWTVGLDGDARESYTDGALVASALCVR